VTLLSLACLAACWRLKAGDAPLPDGQLLAEAVAPEAR